MVKSDLKKNNGSFLILELDTFFNQFFTCYFSIFFDMLSLFTTLWDMFKMMVIVTLHQNENSFLNIAFDMLF
jgi:hypothetical protein